MKNDPRPILSSTLAVDDGSVIYATGCTPEGAILIGGIWKLWEQEGFPIEMSHLICRDNGWAVDWLEAMADASCTNNCPALVKHIEAFLKNLNWKTVEKRFADIRI